MDPLINEGIFPPDFETDEGAVRLLTSDTSPTDIEGAKGSYLWMGDDEIRALVRLKGSPARAAIYILRLVAMTPAMQLKKWSSADLSVDGPAITRALRDLIKDAEEALGREDGADVSEFSALVPTGASVSQRAFYPRHPIQFDGIDLDPTLPFRVL